MTPNFNDPTRNANKAMTPKRTRRKSMITRFDTLDSFLTTGRTALAKGPVALILAEDSVEVESTLAHHLAQGFRNVICFAPEEITPPALDDPRLSWVTTSVHLAHDWEAIVNGVIKTAPENTWVYYGFNAEYLIFPFCETRSISDFTTFASEERRRSVITFVVDLYAKDPSESTNGVERDAAWFDPVGYYGIPRKSPKTGENLGQQMDFYGGLRWRFSDMIPRDRQRIDRMGLFRTRSDLVYSATHLFNIEDYNTIYCPWHNSPTAAIGSFRTTKALLTNPGTRNQARQFHWQQSVEFNWKSQQLLELGIIETGQWF